MGAMTPNELGRKLRRERPMTRARHAKRAKAYDTAADRFGSRSMVLYAEAKRLEQLEARCREVARAHHWAASVSPRGK